MEYQDFKTLEPKPIKHIFTPRDDTTFRDQNLLFLRNILNKLGPLTVKDIIKEFKKSKEVEEKSDKTIYRYLGKLKDLDMVTQVGKRIYVDDLKTETLFGVTAKFFLIGTHNTPFHNSASGELLKRREGLTEFIGEVFKHQYGGKTPNLKCLEKILIDLTETSTETLISNFENTSLEAIEKLMNVPTDGDEGTYLMDFVTWLGLVISKKDLYENLGKCFK
ncbi:MAG: hypothetical protein GOP50_12640 [Candidatus Heimdallarchaeota archaeon]|nr:hypothetical protein [Candidatus Heimdallarchaeota archaeon]